MEIRREGGKEAEEVVKPWAVGSLPCTSGKDTGLCWDLRLGFLGFWETSYLPVVRSLGERMGDMDRADLGSQTSLLVLEGPAHDPCEPSSGQKPRRA